MGTHRQATKLQCLALLDLAQQGDGRAQAEICDRADHWGTCAVGEMATKLGVDPHQLYLRDPQTITKEHIGYTRLEQLGVRFAEEVNARHYGRARRTYQAIARRVKKLFGTKAKRMKLGLQSA